MKTTSLMFWVCLTCSVTAGAAEFYASPNGTPGGNGTSALPWDLQTALSQPGSVVRPGDIVWLRGGVYTRNKLWSIYRSTLAGTAAQPIFVLQYPAERATIEGSLFQWQGGWVVYRGFELRNSYPHRYTPQPASHPTSFVTYLNGEEVDMNVSGVDLRAPNIRLENLVIHDHIGGGIGVNVEAPGTVVSGCLSYYNGWQAEDRAHGHGMYGQMTEPGTLTVKGCAFYGNYALGFQSYGANDHLTDNVRLEGNTLFFNGILARQHQQNLLIGPNSGLARNPVVSSNCVYDLYGRSSDSFLGYVGGMVNPVITGNYFQTSVMFSENRDGMVLRNNTFLDRLLVFGPEPYPIFDTAAFPDNTYLTSPPPNNYVQVTVDPSYPFRALVTVYNWESASTVPVSFPGLRMVDYEVRSAQDFYAPPVATFFNHPYSDPPQLPLTGLSVAKPVSAAAPESAAPAFATFIVIEKGILGTPRLPNSAPEISPIPAQAFPWNTQSGEIQFTVADAETPAGELAVFATSSNPSLLAPRKIVFGGSGESRSLTLTPEPGAFGSTIVRIAVSDGLDIRLTEFQVDVTHPNQPPQITAISPVTLEEDQVSPPIAFTIGDAETPADSLGINVICSDTALLPIAGIALGGSGVNRTVTLTPAPGQVGTATVTIEATDGEATTSTHFDVTVTPKTVADVTLGLMAWWKLDEATGTSFVDASGLGNTAALVSGYYWAPTPCHILGKIGQGALHLNGMDKYGSGDHLALNSYAPLNLGASSFTLALWMRTTSAADSVLLNKYSSAGMESGYLLAVDGASNGGKPRLRISSGLGAWTYRGTRKLNDGAWHHLAVVVSRENSISFFVDGVLTGSSGNAITGNLNTTAKFTVGKASYYGGWWQGDMDEVRVYGRALSPAEVSLLLASTPNSAPTISPIGGQQVMQDTVSGPVPFTVGDAETPAVGLVVTAQSSDETLLPVGGIVLSGTGADRTLTLQPAAGRYGNANVTVTVSDGALQASTQFLVEVLRANSAPWISAIPSQTVIRATASDWIPFTIGDTETPADALEVTVSSSNTELLPLLGITIGGRFFGIYLGGTGENRMIQLDPRPEDGMTTGTAIITLHVTDGQASTSTSFQVTVVPSGLPDLSYGILMNYGFDPGYPCNGNPCVLVTGYYTFPPVPPHFPDRKGYEYDLYAALYLNGTDRYGGGDYLTTESSSQGNVGSGSFTLSLWVLTTSTKDSVILNKYSSAGMELGYLLAMDGASNGGKPRLRISSGTGARTFKGTGKLNDGAWHHLAVMVDRENSRVSFFVDGVASGAIAGNTSGNLDTSAKFSIGKSSYSGTWWQGAVDDLFIYSRVLCDVELAWLAAAL